MRIRATAAMAAVFFSATSLGSAQNAPPRLEQFPYRLYGQGGSSCGKWLANRGTEAQADETYWVLGWLSAAGAYNVVGPLRPTDSEAIEAWVDKYCREHPLNSIKDAAVSLVDELSKPK